MKKWEEEQRKKAHNKKVGQAKATISKSNHSNNKGAILLQKPSKM
jgi:hypothetical protein